VLTEYVNGEVNTEPANLEERWPLAFYNDIHEISNRIGQSSDIKSIELRLLKESPCVIDQKVDEYIDNLYGTTYEGDTLELPANVSMLQLRKRESVILRNGSHQVKLITDDNKLSRKLLKSLLKVLANFSNLRDQPLFYFPGTQRYIVGRDPEHYPEFVLKTPITKIKYKIANGDVKTVTI